jgi:hypothetical protein
MAGQTVQPGPDRPVGGSSRSGDPVDYPELGESIQRQDSAFLRKLKDQADITSDDLWQWNSDDPELFIKDVSELLKLYKDRIARSSAYRREARNAQDEVAVLTDQLQRLEERMADEKDTAQRNRAIIDRLLAREDVLVEERNERRSVNRDNTPATARTSNSLAEPGLTRVAKLPDPPLFSGEDRAMFDDWLVQVKNKLRGNHEMYPTESLKIIYVAGRLTGTALALVTPRLDEDCQYAYLAVAELYAHLKELYSDPNKANNARREFQNLRMRPSQLFQEFYAQFLRLATESGLSQQDLKYDLNDKLIWDLQAAVATYYNDSSVNMTAFAQYCTTVDQQIKVRTDKQKRAERNRVTFSSQAQTPATPAKAPISALINTPFPRASTPHPEKPKLPNKGIADLSTVKCFNCNKFGHYASSCPLPRTERTRAELARVEQGLESDSEDSLSDSENEEP